MEVERRLAARVDAEGDDALPITTRSLGSGMESSLLVRAASRRRGKENRCGDKTGRIMSIGSSGDHVGGGIEGIMSVEKLQGSRP